MKEQKVKNERKVKNTRLDGNVILMYIHTFLSTFILFYICDTLFFIERGLTSSDYISFVAATFLVKLILEVPCGIIADKYSKKTLLIISTLMFIISCIIFIGSHSYVMFLIGIIINASRQALASGIVNSILYESLDKNNKFKFNKLLFNNSFCYNLSYMIAMVLGGYIGQNYGLVYNYYVTLIPLVLDLLVLSMLRNIKMVKERKDEEINTLQILKNGIGEVIKKPYLIRTIMLSAILVSGIKLVEESHPEYAAKIGISVFVIGIYTALILLFCIIGSYIGSKIPKKLYKMVININPILGGMCILIAGLLNNYVGIIFILLIYLASESFDNIMLSELHHNISSKSRVTVESIKEFVLGIFGVMFSIIMSILLRYIEVYTMYILVGTIIIGYGIINMAYEKLHSN